MKSDPKKREAILALKKVLGRLTLSIIKNLDWLVILQINYIRTWQQAIKEQKTNVALKNVLLSGVVQKFPYILKAEKFL